jgi:hypothetical protein
MGQSEITIIGSLFVALMSALAYIIAGKIQANAKVVSDVQARADRKTERQEDDAESRAAGRVEDRAADSAASALLFEKMKVLLYEHQTHCPMNRMMTQIATKDDLKILSVDIFTAITGLTQRIDGIYIQKGR